MSPDVEAMVQLGVQAAEALVWLYLAIACLQRISDAPWARLGAVGAVLLFVPAMTFTMAQAQVRITGEASIFINYSDSPLTLVYPALRVTGAVCLLAAVVLGRARLVTARP